MHVKRCLDILMRRCGNRKAAETRSALLDELLAAQELLEQASELPWFIISEQTSNTLIIGERRRLLPADFIREVDEAPLMWVDPSGDEKQIVKGEYQDLERDVGFLAVGPPRFYSMRSNYLIFFPLPDQAYPIRWAQGYYARQEQPADSETSENPWFKNASDLLMAMAGMQVAGKVLKDPELVSSFASDRQQAENRLIRVMTAHEEANRDRVMNPE